MYSIGTKVFLWFCLTLCSFAMGSPFQGRVSIPIYVLDRNEGFHWVLSGIVFLHDGATLLGSVVHTLYVLDRLEGFNLICSGFQVPSHWVPQQSCVSVLKRPQSYRRNFLLLAAAPCPCLPHGSRQWTVFFWSHLLLCIEFQFRWLSSFGCPPFGCLPIGSVNLYTVFVLQLALVVLSSFGVSTTIWLRAFAMGSPLWG